MIEASNEPEVIIERVFLWQELKECFQINAFKAGVQDYWRPDGAQILTLAKDISPSWRVELWAKWLGGIGIQEITIVYNNSSTPQNEFEYGITEDHLKQYAADPTPLDQEDIQDLRTELSEISWDTEKSEEAARNNFLFS